jgi:hypothetical protein
MSQQNPFLRPTDEYVRKINPIGQYVDQTSFYLSKMTGKDINSCKEQLTSMIKERKFPNMKNPRVSYFDRDENLDRSVQSTSLSNYINGVIAEGQILAPTFTSYAPSSVHQSLLVEFIDNNVKRRAKAKKEAFVAKANKQKDLYIAKNNEQDNMKRYNNSLSGAFVAGGSIVNNPTAHSTLTSITRTFSSLSNASNERIIAGNRHYRDPKVTLFNCISITSSLDKPGFQAFLLKYNIHVPTVDEVMDILHYSTDMYWKDYRESDKIRKFIEALDGCERAAIVYIGDLYHIRKFNPEFVRTFLTRLSMKIKDKVIDNPLEVLKTVDEQIINYVHQICMTDVKGIGKDYSKVDPSIHNTLAATSLNIVDTIHQYKDFITQIFLTNNLPPSTAYISNMIRRTVVLSDTDSTMFAVDEWVTWYFGELIFTEEAYALGGSIMFIATQCIAHSLAIFSANMNVERKKIHQGAMKPEYVFSVMVLTSVAKHYFTSILVKEGNVYGTEEMEIKGVHLKNSASPRDLIKNSHAKMKEIIEKVTSGKKISIVEEIKRVKQIETDIHTSLISGKVAYYKSAKIKSPDAYAKTSEESPYQHHILWNEVFSDKYGPLQEPPYEVIKVPTIVVNPSSLLKWVESIEDVDFKDRLQKWLARKAKKNLPTLYLSKQFVASYGIPKEIVPIIDTKRIILDLTKTDRMILESLGYFIKENWLIGELGQY